MVDVVSTGGHRAASFEGGVDSIGELEVIYEGLYGGVIPYSEERLVLEPGTGGQGGMIRLYDSSPYNGAHGQISFVDFGDGGLVLNSQSSWSSDISLRTNGITRAFVDSGGSFGIGTTNPAAGLHVAKVSDASLAGGGGVVIGDKAATNIVIDSNEIIARNDGLAAPLYLNHDGGSVHVGGNSGGTGRLVAPVVEITGGADIVEGFETAGATLEPGSVVVIDPDRPGMVRGSYEAYDAKVAGVVSGAGGVRPGLRLGQEGVLSGDTAVAMTGRVYVRASTENGAIRPGDLLTTAALAGHAMRASDRQRSFGAVIGKAMGALDEGTGLVLVLVNLQ